MRLSEIADHLTELEGREPDELHIKMRNPLFKALLEGRPGRSRNSPLDYAPQELIRARLLVAMQDVGLSTADLARANMVLNQPDSGIFPRPASMGEPGGLVPSALRSMIRGVRAGEPWHIRVTFVREADGSRNVRVRVDCGDMGIREEEKRAIAAVKLLNVPQTVGYLFIPAADLVAPLLHLIPEAEG